MPPAVTDGVVFSYVCRSVGLSVAIVALQKGLNRPKCRLEYDSGGPKEACRPIKLAY